MMFGMREQFDYFQCGLCECLQIIDIPQNIEKYYPHNYPSYDRSWDKGSQKKQPNFIYRFLQKQRVRAAVFGHGHKLNRLLSHFIDFPKEMYANGPIIRRTGIKDFRISFLDVGCGTQSWWLNEMKKLGFSKLIGIDPFIDQDKKTNGIQILKKQISEMPGQFSLITFHHSFEHVPDPRETLEAAKRLLAPEGVCLIRIPLVSSYVWEQYGENWVELDAPRHLFLHSLKSMNMLAGQVGLEIFEVIHDSTEFEFYGSEQYLRDIPLISDSSYFINPENSIFSPTDIETFKERARQVNAEKRGGRAAFYLRISKIASTK